MQATAEAEHRHLFDHVAGWQEALVNAGAPSWAGHGAGLARPTAQRACPGHPGRTPRSPSTMTSLGGMTSCRLYSSGFCVAGSPSVWLLWFGLRGARWGLFACRFTFLGYLVWSLVMVAAYALTLAACWMLSSGFADQGDADDECRCGEHGGSHAPSDDAALRAQLFVVCYAEIAMCCLLSDVG